MEGRRRCLQIFFYMSEPTRSAPLTFPQYFSAIFQFNLLVLFETRSWIVRSSFFVWRDGRAVCGHRDIFVQHVCISDVCRRFLSGTFSLRLFVGNSYTLCRFGLSSGVIIFTSTTTMWVGSIPGVTSLWWVTSSWGVRTCRHCRAGSLCSTIVGGRADLFIRSSVKRGLPNARSVGTPWWITSFRISSVKFRFMHR